MTAGIQPIIVTSDLDRLMAFYTGLLGAEEIVRVPGQDGSTFFVNLRVSGGELGLVAEPGVGNGPGGRILLSVDVPDVDALLSRVEQLGGRVNGPANDTPWGQRVAHVQDPDGNALNLTQALT
ncbi:MAG TPA: VOC family protein [Actinopolymorphaceae bacterium]